MLRVARTLCFAAVIGSTCAAWAQAPVNNRAASWVRPRLVGRALNSGWFELDRDKLRALFPEFDWSADQLAYLEEHLDRGDTRAAIVASVDPLVVSAYSDELDAVLLVEFPEALVAQYQLNVGERLIACWTYPKGSYIPSDVVQGEHNRKRQTNGVPLIADFFSSSSDKIQARKASIAKQEWQRLRELTSPALNRAHGVYRSCFPLDTGLPPERREAFAIEK